MSQQENSKSGNLANWGNLVIGTVIGAAGLALAYASLMGWKPALFSGKDDRFTCGLQPDTSTGGEVWTLSYHNDKGKQPWLKMVNSFGDDWNTQKRCETIAERLEGFRKDGLINFYYRSDPKTPAQEVICAKTRLSGDSCELVVTLIPGANGYESLRKMTEALRDGNTVDQSSNGAAATPSFSPSSPMVDVTSFLADEDLKAGSASK